MRVIILGASGFLGAALFTRLSNDGIDVVGAGRGAPLEPGDVTDLSSLKTLFAEHTPDVIVNLAAAGVSPGFVDLARLTEVNRAGPQNVMNAMHSVASRALLIHVSSSREISNDGRKPATAYGQSKAEGTALVLSEINNGELNGLVVQLHNTYGATQPSSRLIQWVTTRALSNQVIELRNPSAIRDFVYIDDVVDALVSAIRVGTGSKPVFRSVNTCIPIGTGVGHPVIDVVHLVVERLNSRSMVITTQPNHDELQEPAVVIADPSLAKQVLGWNSRTHLTEGVSRTLKELK